MIQAKIILLFLITFSISFNKQFLASQFLTKIKQQSKFKQTNDEIEDTNAFQQVFSQGSNSIQQEIPLHWTPKLQIITPTANQPQIQALLLKLQNKRVGFLTNPTSVDSKLTPLLQKILSSKYNTTLVCFFAPEHGLRGDREAGRGDDDYIDEQTNIPVYSLYGVRKAPTAQQLNNLDMLLYDIQDIGVRFYTYIWTLTYTIEVLPPTVTLVIYDRPNPLGRTVEGCPLRVDAGLIGRLLPRQPYSIPIRYGLTIAEFVLYLRRYLPTFNLAVIKHPNDPLSSPWVLPSPNIPTFASALVYPGVALLEQTTASEGRGTTKPFQISGIPNTTAKCVRTHLTSNYQDQSCIIREAYFIPTFSKHTNEVCGGVEIHVVDTDAYRPVETALHLIKAYLNCSNVMTVLPTIDKIWGRLGFHADIATRSVEDILADCQSDLAFYLQEYKTYWLYPSRTQL